jgi:hypothetical protein
MPPFQRAFVADDRRLYGSGANAKSDSAATTRVNSPERRPLSSMELPSAAEIAAFFKRADELWQAIRADYELEEQAELEQTRLASAELEGAGAARSPS